MAYRNSLLNLWNIVHGGKILTIIIIIYTLHRFHICCSLKDLDVELYILINNLLNFDVQLIDSVMLVNEHLPFTSTSAVWRESCVFFVLTELPRCYWVVWSNRTCTSLAYLQSVSYPRLIIVCEQPASKGWLTLYLALCHFGGFYILIL